MLRNSPAEGGWLGSTPGPSAVTLYIPLHIIIASHLNIGNAAFSIGPSRWLMAPLPFFLFSKSGDRRAFLFLHLWNIDRRCCNAVNNCRVLGRRRTLRSPDKFYWNIVTAFIIYPGRICDGCVSARGNFEMRAVVRACRKRTKVSTRSAIRSVREMAVSPDSWRWNLKTDWFFVATFLFLMNFIFFLLVLRQMYSILEAKRQSTHN